MDNSRELNKVREWKNRQKEFLKEHPELKRVYANEKTYLPKLDNRGKIIEDGNVMAEYTKIGKINTKILEKEFGKVNTNQVILMDERKQHILERHPEDFSFFEKYVSQCIADPDLVVKETKKKGTIFMIKKLKDSNLNVLVRLVLENDNPGYINSIMTSYRVNSDNLDRILRKNKLIYKKE